MRIERDRPCGTDTSRPRARYANAGNQHDDHDFEVGLRICISPGDASRSPSSSLVLSISAPAFADNGRTPDATPGAGTGSDVGVAPGDKPTIAPPGAGCDARRRSRTRRTVADKAKLTPIIPNPNNPTQPGVPALRGDRRADPRGRHRVRAVALDQAAAGVLRARCARESSAPSTRSTS